MQQDVVIKNQVFKKNSDGSWVAVQNTDIEVPIGTVRIPRGMVFRTGMQFYGIDVAALLDRDLSSG